VGGEWFLGDKRIAVADAIHHQQRQRSRPTGNYSGRLSVWHPIPLPKLKFRGLQAKRVKLPLASDSH